MKKVPYNDKTFGKRSDSLVSAKIIVPLILDLVKAKSVVDVGCGNGEFLSIFKENGIESIFGIEGEWANKNKLRIPQKCFMQTDLEQPLKLNKFFDLVVSLEVAEHLSKEAAKTFIETLTNLGPVIVFSAAIPFQNGVHHVNNQWPSYWANIFQQKNYVPVDCIRKKIWENKDVSFWYSQNIIIFVKEEYLKTNKILQKEFEQSKGEILSMVHPKLYLPKAKRDNVFVKMVPPFIKEDIRKILNILKLN